ncbi:hypothetical protein [Paenibacillus sp. UMB4589-SE434]|uniref:hypothetical protein n=1 Tax=Paenibacillus sp. UMB4589-SE434 TaxID=3046314 RepID=UPI00254B73ED|nr:hypothetical protein [Paenibacillus sp. UMB4589-SE434]MDK8183737.1 hypothetical protein [Paenibacillus sp. UMB4589-SE434]
MFDSLKQYITKLIDSLDKGIVIESEVLYGDAKLEYALSKENFMASISVLSDYTYDFFTVEIESENTLSVKTEKFTNLDDLLAELKADLLEFSSLE